jgi:hypothetical protein
MSSQNPERFVLTWTGKCVRFRFAGLENSSRGRLDSKKLASNEPYNTHFG